MKKYLFLSLVLAVLAMAFVPSEKYTLTGRIIDATGVPVAGASVTIKGTRIGTAADPAGYFRLVNITGKETLVISAVSFKTEEVRLRNRKTLNVILTAARENLQEVVVVGYGTNRRESVYTGGSTDLSFATSAQPVQNVLQGRVAGIRSGGHPRWGLLII